MPLSVFIVPLRKPYTFRRKHFAGLHIEKLKEASATNLQALSGLSEVRLSPTAVLKITRDSTSALRDAVTRESLVVVGQPGAGKTGALYDSANGLAAIGDVLVFGVDHFEAKSLASLRIELGCTHDVLQVLGNWPGLRPGFLIIDALDAARTDLGAKTFRELIAAVLALNGRWHVIPSIRKYDLRHSSELKSLFVGAPHSTFHDPEFGRVKHIEIWCRTGRARSSPAGLPYSYSAMIFVAGEAPRTCVCKSLLQNHPSAARCPGIHTRTCSRTARAIVGLIWFHTHPTGNRKKVLA